VCKPRGGSILTELALERMAVGGFVGMLRSMASPFPFPSSDNLPESCGIRFRGWCGLRAPNSSRTTASADGRAIGDAGGTPLGNWKGG
jgi:hypothetical protein